MKAEGVGSVHMQGDRCMIIWIGRISVIILSSLFYMITIQESSFL